MKHQAAFIARNQKSRKTTFANICTRNVPIFLWYAKWSIFLIFSNCHMLQQPHRTSIKFFYSKYARKLLLFCVLMLVFLFLCASVFPISLCWNTWNCIICNVSFFSQPVYHFLLLDLFFILLLDELLFLPWTWNAFSMIYLIHIFYRIWNIRTLGLGDFFGCIFTIQKFNNFIFFHLNFLRFDPVQVDLFSCNKDHLFSFPVFVGFLNCNILTFPFLHYNSFDVFSLNQLIFYRTWIVTGIDDVNDIQVRQTLSRMFGYNSLALHGHIVVMNFGCAKAHKSSKFFSLLYQFSPKDRGHLYD